MATFKDNKGRSWGIDITIGTLRRVRQELDLNLVEIFSGDLLDRLAGDPVLLGELLWVLCAEQADREHIEPEEFGQLAGDAVEEATKALEVALADFFPTRKRSALKSWIQKRDRILDLAISAAEKDLAGDQAERLLAEVLAEQTSAKASTVSSTSATSSPPSSGSTPPASASAG